MSKIIRGRKVVPKTNCCGKKVDRTKKKKITYKKIVRKRK